MSSLCETSEILLYSKLFEEFKASDSENLHTYLNNIKYNEAKYIFFVLIKHHEHIVKEFTFSIKNNDKLENNILKLEKRIQKELEFTNEREQNDLTIKLAPVKKSQKEIFKKFKHEFCILRTQLNHKENKKGLANFIYKHKVFLFSTLTILFATTFIFQLSKLGILINFVSVDTITMITHQVVFVIAIGTMLMLLGNILIVPIIMLMDKFTFIVDCSYLQYSSKKMVKSLVVIFISIFTFFMSLENIFLYLNKDPGTFKYITESYIIQTREPSIREIQYKDDNKTILLMGKNEGIIHFIYINDIKEGNISKTKRMQDEIQDKICKEKKDAELSYIDALFTLLTIKEDDNETNYIADRRYQTLTINDIHFTDRLPDFFTTFCINKVEQNLKKK